MSALYAVILRAPGGMRREEEAFVSDFADLVTDRILEREEKRMRLRRDSRCFAAWVSASAIGAGLFVGWTVGCIVTHEVDPQPAWFSGERRAAPEPIFDPVVSLGVVSGVVHVRENGTVVWLIDPLDHNADVCRSCRGKKPEAEKPRDPGTMLTKCEACGEPPTACFTFGPVGALCEKCAGAT